MLRLVALFALLAVAFAAPKPDIPILTYSSGIPLTYGGIGSSIGYPNLAYGYTPYASGYYNYYNPLGYL